jgi:ketosteroid isomerase-like protein
VNEQRNVGIVQEMYAAFGRGDLGAVLARLDDDVVWTNPGPEHIPYFGTKRGPDEVAAMFTWLATSCEITRFEPQSFLASRDQVVALLAFEGVARSTGKAFGGRVAHLFEFDADGRVVAFHDFQDNHSVVSAIDG